MPVQLVTLTELHFLDLSDNQLSGAIPPELGDLSPQGLVSLDLSANQLNGTIPAELGDLRSLNVLHLNDNQLTGEIPAELGDFGSLTELSLGNNRLSGAIPLELGSLTLLLKLDLGGNQLTGEIPPELGDLGSLTQLSLRDNRLSGTIPAPLGNLSRLEFARFANNAFTGCVPDGLRDLLNQPDFATDVPAHDFARDANGDGDTADPGDIAGLALPFCGLSDLTLGGGLTLEPDFASGVEAYTAAAAYAVTSTMVTASLNYNADELSITKGADTYTNRASVPLDVGPNLIAIVVTATDGSTAPHTYRVTVTRAHNTPPVFDEGAAATRGVDENTGADQPIGDALAASDADSADTLTYSLDTASDALFDINSATGQLRTEAELDHETRKSYPVNVSVSDGKDANGDADASADSTIKVTVLVSDVNESASFGSVDPTRTIEENTPAGVPLGAPFQATDGDGDTLTYSLGVNNAEDFEIDAASGQLRTRAALDYETKSTYSLGVIATSGTLNNAIVVTVTVENVEEPGTVTLSSVQPRVGDTLSARLTDPDVVSGAVVWAWERSTSRTSGWTAISGATSASYTTVDADADYYLRATASYDDGAGAGKSASAVSANPVRAFASGNSDPSFPSVPDTRTVDENEPAGTIVGTPFVATDADSGRLTYFLSGPDAAAFEINSSSGQLRTRAVLDYETKQSYQVDVTATDPSGGFGKVEVTISVGNVQEAGTATLSPLQPVVGIQLTATPDDPDGVVGAVQWLWERSPDQTSWTTIGGTSAVYTPLAADVGAYLRATASYRDGADAGQSAEAVSAHPVREPRGRQTPVFSDGESTTRGTTKTAPSGVNIGAPVAATDGDNDRLSYSLGGPDMASFDIDESFGQLRTSADLNIEDRDSYTVTVSVSDGKDDQGNPDPDAAIDATIEVTINFGSDPVTPPIITGGGGGGGGGGPSGPTPSGIEFEWNVTRDIEALDSGHEAPTGAWSDGTLLWLAENGDGADDAVYAYDLVTGERVEEREFELDETNRAPRGLWSDGKTAWVADSGQDRLFAYDLESGERDEEREVEFDTRNRDPRGIWSDGTIVWVLDGGKNALFAYDLASGELIAEYALDDANGDPRGLWSDGVTVWVSDHGAKRLFAYRLAAPDTGTTTGEDEEAAPLERARDEEFTELSRASNNSPRGIWSDGEVMYVADESDGRVYSYNLPDAIDARLASLTLSGVDFGEFDPGLTEYEGVSGDGVTETTVAAEASQRRASVSIEPPDANLVAEGHQVALDGLEEITVTVTSADESRTKVYLVRFGDAAEAEQPVVACLRGAITVGFSLLVAEGGSVEELVSCAESRSVTALYALHEGEYVSYILGAPAFVNSAFREVYSGGVPALTPLIAKSEGPPSADPAAGSAGDGEPWPLCLRGAIVEGFSLVLYEGGSVDALDACAQSLRVTAVYALHEGEYVSYILGAPDFVNAAFRELFADGLPAVTPLVVKSEGPPRAN